MLESVWENAAHKHVGRMYNTGEKTLGKDFSNVLSDEQSSTKKQFFEPPFTAKGPQFLGLEVTDQHLNSVLSHFLPGHAHDSFFLAHQFITDTGFVKLAAHLKTIQVSNILFYLIISFRFLNLLKPV